MSYRVNLNNPVDQSITDITNTANFLCVRFKEWLDKAKPHENFVYYTGAHLSDLPHMVRVRKFVWDKALKGDVYLVQKKLGLDKYEYRAIKSQHRITKLIPLDFKPFKTFYLERPSTRSMLNGVN